MFEYIKRLQGKPPGERKRVALILSGTITAIIFLIWLSIFGLNKEASQQKETIDLSPLQSIKDEVGNIFNTFKDVSDNLQKVKDLPPSVTATTTEENATTTP